MPAIPVRVVAERRVAERLLRRHAVRPDHAIFYEPDRPLRAHATTRLLRAGVLREEQGGRLYLDAARWSDRLDDRRKRLTVIAAAVVAVGVLLSGR